MESLWTRPERSSALSSVERAHQLSHRYPKAPTQPHRFFSRRFVQSILFSEFFFYNGSFILCTQAEGSKGMRMRFQSPDDLELLRVEVWSTCLWQVVTQEFKHAFLGVFPRVEKVDVEKIQHKLISTGLIPNKLHEIQAWYSRSLMKHPTFV